LAAGGAHVVAAARGNNAQGTVDAILAAGGSAEVATLDVTDPASVDAVVTGVLARHKRIDVLVNNAGVTRDQLMLRMKRDDWDAVIAANLTGAYTCVQAVLKSMVRARAGRIISITSVVGEAGNAGQVNYAASKAGLIGFTKALALEVASRGITVNAVAPGLVDTDMTKAISAGAHEEWAKKIPLQRLGTPEDIAAAVRFLASDEAAYITGHVLSVNGGMHT
jgi:3-oxoacyl-[acyl-carrier protein] reductase